MLTRFESWKSKYNKSYGASEHQERYNIFKSNAEFIDNHYSPNFSVGENQFMDLTLEEF